MNLNEELITRFYDAFHQLDYKTMQDCYHEEAVFFDPVFQDLNSTEVKMMWEMLCSQARDLKIQFAEVQADEEYGTCQWTASYTFTTTGRKVINRVKAHFKFRDGKIIEHTDDFNLWNWSRQALGLKGLLLGWSNFLQKKLNASADEKLLRFLNKKTATGTP